MKAKAKQSERQTFLMNGLSEMLDPRQPLKKLADRIPWERFENAFAEHYSEKGRPAKPIRVMVGLLILKQLENLSDEALVERWVQNPYCQYFLRDGGVPVASRPAIQANWFTSAGA